LFVGGFALLQLLGALMNALQVSQTRIVLAVVVVAALVSFGYAIVPSVRRSRRAAQDDE
jgi:uncharacterized sodium:solute symporter family permease YidK